MKILKLIFGVLFGILILIFALLFVFRDKLANAALAMAKTELAESGIFVEWTLEPVSVGPDLGLKLRDIKAFQDSSLKETAASLSNLDLKVHLLPTLLNRKPFLAISTADATLSILDLEPKAKPEDAEETKATPEEKPVEPVPPTAPAKPEVPPTVTISEINLNVDFDPSQVTVAPSKLLFQGVRFEASGSSKLPPAPKAKHEPLIKQVEVKDPTAPADPSKLDFSALALLAEALDYRKADFKPEVKIAFTTGLDSDSAWVIDAKADTVSFPSRNKNLAATASLIVRHNGSGALRTVVIKDGDASAEGNASIEEAFSALNVTAITSTLDWIAILQDLPAVGHSLDSLKVTKAPTIELSGLWSIADMKQSNMVGSIKGLDATWTNAVPAAGKTAPSPPTPLIIQAAGATIELTNGRLRFAEGFATVADGPVSFEFGLQPFETNAMPWTTKIAGENIGLGQVTGCFAETKVEGTANLSFEGSGDIKPAALSGQGNLLITASQPLKVPVVGPLLDLLATVIPNLLKTGSDRLETSFVIKDGLLSTKDLSVGLSAAQVKASGTINLVTEETSFQANANLRGPLQKFTPGLGEALAIEGGGPLKKVQWRFKNLQSVSSLSDLIKGKAAPVPAPATPGSAQTPGTATPPSKTDELLRTVDQIGGLIKGLKGEVKPVPAPVPAPPAPNP